MALIAKRLVFQGIKQQQKSVSLPFFSWSTAPKGSTPMNGRRFFQVSELETEVSGEEGVEGRMVFSCFFVGGSETEKRKNVKRDPSG